MKKFFKLLCYSLITVFLLGLGGEKVSAEPSEFRAQRGEMWYDDGKWNSTVKTIAEGTYAGKYIFCLDSKENIFLSGVYKRENNLVRPYLQNDDVDFRDQVSNVINQAYRKFGLGDGETIHQIDGYSVSETELYGITQVAVWYAAHGTGDNGYTNKYKTWIEDTQHPYRENIYLELIKHTNFSYFLQLDASGNMIMTDNNSGHLVSNEYTVRTNVPANITISSSDGQIKVNNGDLQDGTSIGNIKNGDKIKIYKSTQGINGKVSITLTATSDQFTTGYSIFTYVPDGFNTADSKKQNMVLALGDSSQKSASIVVTGNYDQKGTIKIRKLDATTHRPVYGAKLQLLRQEGPNTYSTVADISYDQSKVDTEDTDGYITFSNMELGHYCLAETKAPSGYKLSGERACGDLSTDSETPLELSLELLNNTQRVKYRKVMPVSNEENGEKDYVPIEGVRIEIHDYGYEFSSNNHNYPYICGISDADGYLTQKCPGWDDENTRIISPDENGSFPIAWNRQKQPEARTIIMVINEDFKADYYYNPALAFGDTAMDFGFVFREEDPDSGEEIFSYGPAMLPAQDYTSSPEYDPNDDNIIVNIHNAMSFKISKQDTGTGKEIAGAQMLLCDTNLKDNSVGDGLDLSEDQIPFVCVDSWVSDGSEHTFVGIVPDHIYSLTEITPPKGYQKLETEIKFKVDYDGKVELISTDAHAVIPKKSSSYLIINNDLLVDTPSTGVSILNKVAIGGLLVFVGYEIIKFRKMKANS